MKMTPFILFSPKRKELFWADKFSTHSKNVKIGHIKQTKCNKSTNVIEFTMEFDIKKLKKIMGINHHNHGKNND